MAPLPMTYSRFTLAPPLAAALIVRLLASLLASLLVGPPAAHAETAADKLPAATADSQAAAATRFFEQHCLRCHDGQTQEGQFRIDDLSRDFTSLVAAEKWAEVMTRINAGEMPPEEEPRPTADEIAGVIGWIDDQIRSGEAARMAARGPIAHYRLSREEYAHTIYDLLGVHYDVAQPGALLEDPRWHGFERIGALLSLAPSHVERYLKAAETVIARAFPEHDIPPATFRADALTLLGSHHGHEARAEMQKRIEAAGLTDKVRMHAWPGHEIPAWKTWWRAQDFKTPGVYRMRITASGMRPPGGRVPHLSVWDPRQRESIFDADVLTGEDATTVLEFERFLEMPLELMIRNEVPGRLPEGHQANTTKPYTGNVFTGSRDRRLLHPTGHKLVDDDGNAIHPLLLVDSVELEGPIVTADDRRKREGFWPADLEAEAEIRECLGRFAERAWRRPVEPEEIDRYLAVVRGVRGAGESPRSAYQAALVGVLASKNFFYLEQGSAAEPRVELTDWELASRLSYFLWGSLPDEPLLAAARSGTLRQPEVLRSQVARMIADPKIARFTDAFPRQWLQLYRVGMFPPDRKLYPDYDLWLEASMIEEPLRTFATAFHDNLPIRDLVAGDWSIVNARLAEHYQLPPLPQADFTRVAFAPEHHRGGLLTQAAVLSLSSDGTRHRPVHRGVWVSEAIFGVTPPPPPPNVDALEPQPADVEKLTVRMQLAAHSTTAACAACHRKIDPLGFAFDNYDAIGRWRTHERLPTGKGEDPPVDASGTLADGRAFAGPDEFKQLLAADSDRFAEAVATALATFGLRRAPTIDDTAAIRGVVAAARADGYRLRSLVEALATSDLFQKR